MINFSLAASEVGSEAVGASSAPTNRRVYDARKHHISVFVFQERPLPAKLNEGSLSPKLPAAGVLSSKSAFRCENAWRDAVHRYAALGPFDRQ